MWPEPEGSRSPLVVPGGGVPPWAVPPWAVPPATDRPEPPATDRPEPPDSGPPSFRRAFRPTVLWALASTLAGLVAGAAIMIVTVLFVTDVDNATAAVATAAYPVMFCGSYLTARRVSDTHGTGDLGADFGWRRVQRSDLGWGVLAGLAAIAVQLLIGLVLSHPDDGRYRSAMFGDDPDWVIIFVMAVPVVVGAPIFEELLFRGPVQRSLIERWGVWPGLVLQGAVFAVHHVPGAVNLLQAGYFARLLAVGVLFGFVRQRTGRLAPAQIAHAVMNVLAFAALVAPR